MRSRRAGLSRFHAATRISRLRARALLCAELAHAPDPVLGRFLLTKQKSAASRAGARIGTAAIMRASSESALASPWECGSEGADVIGVACPLPRRG